MFRSLIMFGMTAAASALELTPDNWEASTAGKTVFVKFFAPWCGHCKAMKPAWDSLMTEYADSDKILIADVDCINAGKPLCEANGVQGFPTLKYGSGTSLEDYKGGRDLSALQAFASELKPGCDVVTLENCDDAAKTVVKDWLPLALDVLEAKVVDHDQAKETIEGTFRTGVEGLQKQFEKMSSTKDEQLAELAAKTNLGVLRSIIAHKKSTKDEL